MTKLLNSIQLSSVTNTDFKETQLSIQINLDGFSFCIYKLPEKEPILFQRIDFNEKATTPERHLKQIETIFSENKFLNESFNHVSVVHQNELATLVPAIHFDENNLKNYLINTVKVLPIDFISFENIPTLDATAVYIPFVNINNFLFNQYGSFEYYHCFSRLAELLKKEDLINPNNKIFVQVNRNDFELLAFKNNQLQVINRFDFITAEDFIYYILFVAEQLNLDTESFELILIGDIEKESELFDILYKYIRNIRFYNNDTELPEEFNEIPKHSNFILLNQNLI